MTVEFTLNGRKVCAVVEADDSLCTVLRGLGMYSVKCGCETTNCGLCTVHMDGKAVLSCSVPAMRCAGHEIVTLEGMQERRSWASASPARARSSADSARRA